MKKQKSADTIKTSRAIMNNIYALSLMKELSFSRLVHAVLLSFSGYFEWIFYSVFFMRYVIQALDEERDVQEILFFLLITVLVFSAISIYNSYAQGKVLPVTDAVTYKKLYKKLFKKARNLELSCFEDKEFYNKYTLAMDDTGAKLLITIDNVCGIVFGIIAGAVSFSAMYEIDPFAMAFVIFPLLGNFIFDSKLQKIDYARNKEINPHNRRVAYVNRVMYLSDYAKEVRLTNVFSLMKRQYQQAIDGMVRVTKKYTLIGVIFHWFRVMFTFTFIFEGVLLYGAYQTMVSKSMTLAELAALSTIMVTSTWILIQFAESLIASFKNGLYIENLRSFLHYVPAIPEDYDGLEPESEIRSLEFRGVCFSYKNEEVIHDMSFELRGGCSYAMVGHNGAGKTTIIKLIMRLYDPDKGEILMNGRNIKEYNLAKYRALFATAFQDYKIFALSVKENVLMGQPGEDETVISALKKSGVYEKVNSLPDGIHTILTKEYDENGVVLSGGENQKIVVARAFVKDVPIKLLDEPSSALDPIAEYQLFESIMKDGRDKTMLFISHRLSSVQDADWVFMMEKGRIAEEGTHSQLMKLKGVYQQMYNKQAENYLA